MASKLAHPVSSVTTIIGIPVVVLMKAVACTAYNIIGYSWIVYKVT